MQPVKQETYTLPTNAHPSSVHSIFQASKLSSVSTVFCWNCVHGFSVIILIDGFGVIILIEHTFQQITREIKRFVIHNTHRYPCVIFSGQPSVDECFPLEVITAKYVLSLPFNQGKDYITLLLCWDVCRIRMITSNPSGSLVIIPRGQQFQQNTREIMRKWKEVISVRCFFNRCFLFIIPKIVMIVTSRAYTFG